MEADRISEQEAHAIGVDAYIYLYPLLSMDITRKQFTNIAPGKEFGKGPMNMFVSVPAYPPADFKGVVRSNFDTLYSIAWLDLSEESLVISVPDTNGRFYLLPMLDMVCLNFVVSTRKFGDGPARIHRQRCGHG